MQHIRPEDLIVIDIETASSFASFDDMPSPLQDLWDEKTAKVRTEAVSAAQFYPLRAGVMAEFARIVCISIAYFVNEEPMKLRVKSFCCDDEKSILNDFIITLQKFEGINSRRCFAGHNIKEFDIPFICRRLLINDIRIPSFLDFQNMKPWETNIIDTFQYWRFGDYKNFTSLKLLAYCMGVPSPKDDIDGSMVGELFWETNDAQKSENMKRISTYCQKDVVTTANIILRFKNLPTIKEEDVSIAG